MSSHWNYAFACGLIPLLLAIREGWVTLPRSFDKQPYLLQWLNMMLFLALPWIIAAALRYLLPFRVVRILAFCCYGILGLLLLAAFFNIFGWLALSIRQMGR